ncbi:MAG: hypothetical protein ACK559_22495, partial [bacterium]
HERLAVAGIELEDLLPHACGCVVAATAGHRQACLEFQELALVTVVHRLAGGLLHPAHQRSRLIRAAARGESLRAADRPTRPLRRILRQRTHVRMQRKVRQRLRQIDVPQREEAVRRRLADRVERL